MDRKKTIVMAVAINAGLLVVLFIAAVSMQEPQKELSRALDSQTPKPLFSDHLDMQQSRPIEVFPTEPPLSSSSLAAPEEPIAYPLPPRAVDIPVPASFPVSSVTQSSSQLAGSTEISVQKGDSLEKIAKNYHTTVDEIIRLNQLPSSFLRVGQKLKIPAEKGLPSSPKTKQPLSTLSPASAEYYTMKVGDNPWSVALKHHMKVDELLKLNGLNEEKARKLKPGDRLRIR